MRKFKSAFTMAEILVTLGVIGVIASLTIPAVVGNYNKQAYATQLKKTYTDLTNAFSTYISDQRVDNVFLSDITSYDGIKEFLTNYFSVAKDCGKAGAGCFASGGYGKYNNSAADKFNPVGYNVLLSNGVAISMYPKAENVNYYGVMYVDVNGAKGPNLIGRDLFYMTYVQKDSEKSVSIADRSGKIDAGYFTKYCGKPSNTLAHGCFSKVIEDNWKMKY